MIEVTVESIRVSLINQQRLVVLREAESPRYLPIWIGPFEAEAITMGLQQAEISRPMTHDLLCGVIDQLGGTVQHIVVNDLHDSTFYALIVLDIDGETMEIDSRPSDAIAMAVRLDVPIFVEETVMESAGQLPSTEYEGDEAATPPTGEVDEEQLEVFRDFIEGLDLEDLDDDE